MREPFACAAATASRRMKKRNWIMCVSLTAADGQPRRTLRGALRNKASGAGFDSQGPTRYPAETDSTLTPA